MLFTRDNAAAVSFDLVYRIVSERAFTEQSIGRDGECSQLIFSTCLLHVYTKLYFLSCGNISINLHLYYERSRLVD